VGKHQELINLKDAVPHPALSFLLRTRGKRLSRFPRRAADLLAPDAGRTGGSKTGVGPVR
jgi:hypothetical protein